VLLYRTLILLFFFFALELSFAQPTYQFALTTTSDMCLKASAGIEIIGTEAADSVRISWSNGETNTKRVYELKSGEYSVNVWIRHKQDTVFLIKDTTFYFTIEKELCAVTVDKYFSPNDDKYHDLLIISNTQYYPDFELSIFNKWGQQVHHQKKEYTPWDGTWNGIPMPDGTYFYVFFYDSAKKKDLIKGDITILR